MPSFGSISEFPISETPSFRTFTVVSIGSAEAFGADISVEAEDAIGIPSAEAFGAVAVRMVEVAGSIPSAEAFGLPQLFRRPHSGSGGAVLLAVVPPGSRELRPAPQRFVCVGIASAEAFGLPDLRQGVDAVTAHNNAVLLALAMAA